jgi:hypothetical protein
MGHQAKRSAGYALTLKKAGNSSLWLTAELTR